MRLGLDSLQVLSSGYVKHASHEPRAMTEVVVCNHPAPVCGTCPHGLRLRSGLGAGTDCACDEGAGIINCGRLRRTPCADSGSRWVALAEWASAQVPVSGRPEGQRTPG